MLETIKSYIDELPEIPFSKLYVDYIMKVQDDNIDKEISFLLNNNNLTVMRVDKLIQKSVERLIRGNGRNKRTKK